MVAGPLNTKYERLNAGYERLNEKPNGIMGKRNQVKDKDKVEVKVESEEFNASRSGSLKRSMPSAFKSSKSWRVKG